MEWGIQPEYAAISSEQDKIGLLCGFSSSFPATSTRPQGIGTAIRPDITITPSGGALIHAADWSAEIKDKANGRFSLNDFIGEMKRKGILAESNISAPSKGIFQSDTGEIVMRAKENLMKVVTPRTEAVALENNKGETLQQLKVINTDVSALVAVSSMDGRVLADSKRIVLVYSTEIANTDMELSGDRVTLIKLGRLPVLMKTGRLCITLKNANPQNLSLYALGLNGVRMEKLPVKVNDRSEIVIVLDTSTLKNGPTPFFEIVAH